MIVKTQGLITKIVGRIIGIEDLRNVIEMTKQFKL